MNENVNVCITPKGDKPVLHFSQFDNERVFTVTVLADDGESAVDLTDLDIEFRLRKTDSHVVTIAPISVVSNVITFLTTEQLCACCGQNIASVVIMNNDSVISTLDILVDIQRDILSGGLTSESDIRNLTTQIEQIVPEVVGDDYYNKQEVDELIAEIPTFDPSNYYDKNYINTMYWTAQQIDQLFYRKTYINDNYYTKDDVYTKSDVYNKTEADNLLSAKMNNIGYNSIVNDAAVISFTTDCNAPLDIIKGNITPVQDLHGYSKPWSGGGGKNKLEPCITSGTVNGVTYTVNDDGTIRLSNTATSEAIKAGSFDLKAGSYIYTSGVTESFDTYDTYLSVGGTTIARGISGYNSFTLAQDTTVMLGVRVRNGITPNVTIKPMIRLASVTDASFEPYSNICPISGFSALNVTLADGDMQTVDTATVNFGQTVYGGVADVTNGKVTVTHKLVTYNGSENWQFLNPSFYIASPNDCRVSQTPIANEYNGVAPTYYNMMINGNIALSTALDNLLVRNDSIASVADFKTALSNNPLTVLYELATPIEITTTLETVSSIAGDNNIYIDTGNLTEIAYFENAEDNLIKLIKACQI